ncbi:MAG TPA: DUF6249 domain-containing protein [Chitinophagaceae bacterium]|nr:DUF6249 domain-containing protein [Chitinophagaceae bacterium]
MPAGVVLIPILISLGFFLMLFGIIYMYKRENLAMIEKGMNPKQFANRPAPYRNLKWALLLIGAGVGLFLAYMLDTYLLQRTVTEVYGGNTYHHREGNNAAIYFSLIAIGGGLGLFGSYRIEKKWWDENKIKE